MSTRVETYYSLHQHCLSYRPSGGRVKHAESMILNDVRFAVQPAGREKVRREGRKNVHAFVRGEPAFIRHVGDGDDGDLTTANMERQGYRPITYNPYRFESFVFADTLEPVHEASQVVLIGKRIYLSGRVKEGA
jgi:hypothetical protein